MHRKRLIDDKDTGGFSVLLVSFEPSAKLNFHTHTYEQILYVTEGEGIVATEEKERIVTPGEVIFIAPGDVHWHGAIEYSTFPKLSYRNPGYS